MSLSELPGAAPGECALSISVSELAKHPLRGLPADPSQTHRQACPVLDHCLDAPIARPASGRLASTDHSPSSPGMTGSLSARRSKACATTAPSAAGSSADSPNLEFSSKYHHDSDRACSASWASANDRLARSAFPLIHPQDTPCAQATSPASVSGVANLVSSTTLSMPSSPEMNASEMRGRPSRV